MKVLMHFFGIVLVTSFFFNGLAIAQSDLQIVENKKVCMVTNMVFPRDQILVKHEGKTYYGCCENCKKTLSEDANSRVAIDPISKKTIDKATAVIAARADGSVIYFENRITFDKYKKLGLNF
ncbi:MAG: hypothetical protein A2622_00100 [Bdellovibrionales bacterium RIFCSPHIGHO2_01_FULL_40_29]|nr:MAG: hypothetical protein A2622_00100 [Bdellovibrionales bacterium RIFCSPHIGHO2_01_FULL_40_29]OFZ32529.1 MAG: hypothetical protein A3D17_04700 [Bdellovibrionales bacterium RIFCSPHIGHO2_02_FULL_40_15]